MIIEARSAKARFAELLERVAAGEEIRVNQALVRGRVRTGTRAQRLVRSERDARD